MTANDLAIDSVSWTFVGIVALAGFVVWIALSLRTVHREKRLHEQRWAALAEYESVTRRCSSRFCGAVIEPGEGRNGLCRDCAHRTYGSAS